MARWRTFLPRVAQSHTVGGVGSADSPLDVFVGAWLSLLGERAATMRYDARLAQAAQQQAEWLAAHDFDERDPHLGANGSTANQRVRATGYPLPAWHGNANTVESVARSWDAPDEAARDLAAHIPHRDHVLGIGFWEASTVYGVGQRDTYYVLITAPES